MFDNLCIGRYVRVLAGIFVYWQVFRRIGRYVCVLTGMFAYWQVCLKVIHRGRNALTPSAKPVMLVLELKGQTLLVNHRDTEPSLRIKMTRAQLVIQTR